MGDTLGGQKPVGYILRTTHRRLKQFCKDRNLADKWIEKDEHGYFIRLHGRNKHS